MFRSAVILFAAALSLFAGTGCSFGPKLLESSHGQYADTIQQVAEEQLLKTIVRLRYNEGSSNLDVSSIAAQYELDAHAEARPFFVVPNPGQHPFTTFTRIFPDISTSKANRPTFTLTPADDDVAVRNIITPISANSFTLFAGNSPSLAEILRVWVAGINGVSNSVTENDAQQGMPNLMQFRRVAELLELAQSRKEISLVSIERGVELSSPLPPEAITAEAAVAAAKGGFEYRRFSDGKSWVLVRKEHGLAFDVNAAGKGSPELLELTELLHVKPGRPRYNVLVVSSADPDPSHLGNPAGDLRVQTRSTMQVLQFLSNGVEALPEHLAAGLARMTPESGVVTSDLFVIHCCHSHKPPACARVAIRYRDWWYYIDDRDAITKETFAQVLQYSRLNYTERVRSGAPLLSLPAGR